MQMLVFAADLKQGANYAVFSRSKVAFASSYKANPRKSQRKKRKIPGWNIGSIKHSPNLNVGYMEADG